MEKGSSSSPTPIPPFLEFLPKLKGVRAATNKYRIDATKFVALQEVPEERLAYMEELCGQSFLPMRIPQSPVVLLLMGGIKYVPPMTDSIATLTMLLRFVRFYGNDQTMKKFRSELQQLDARIKGQLEWERFLPSMQQWTMERIWIYESALHAIFNIEYPIEQCLTHREPIGELDDKELLRKFFVLKGGASGDKERFKFDETIWRQYFDFIKN